MRAGRRWGRILGIVGLLALGSLIIAAYVLLTPRVAVAPSDHRNPQNPLAVEFILTNKGTFPIYRVHASCTVQQITEKDGHRLENVSFPHYLPLKEELPADGKLLIPCAGPEGSTGSPLLRSNIASAELLVKVAYRPAFLDGVHEERFRFVGNASFDGTLRWRPADGAD